MKDLIIYGIPALSHHPLSRANYSKRMVRHVTTPTLSCLANVATRVRLAVRRLTCNELVTVEGVDVYRTNAHTYAKYVVNSETDYKGHPVSRNLDSVVSEVLRIAREREEVAE